MFSNPPSSPFRKGGIKNENFRKRGRKILGKFFKMMEQKDTFKK